MKSALWTVLFSVFVLPVFAQQHIDADRLLPVDASRLPMINTALQAGQKNGNLSKPTGIKQRVTAQVMMNSTNYDSTRYKYSGTRGSAYAYNRLGLGYNTRFRSDYEPLLVDIRESPGMNMLADTILQYLDGAVSSFSTAYYRSDNKMDSFFWASVSPIHIASKDRLAFYPNGNLKYYYTMFSNDGVDFDTTYTRKLFYDATNTRILSDSTYGTSVLTPIKAIAYHYNAAGLYDTVYTRELGAMPVSKPIMDVYTYTASGKIQTIRSYSDRLLNNHYTLGVTDSFAYANNSAFFTYWQENFYNQFGQLTAAGRNIQYRQANSSLPDSFITSYMTDMGTWEDGMGYYTYNTYGNPVMLKYRHSGGQDTTVMKFYYEEFDDLSVKGPERYKPLNVFPNPVDKNISISWEDAVPAGHVQLRLVNTTGQEIFGTRLKLRKGVNTVTLPELQTGPYLLLMHTEAGAAYRCKVLKR